MQKTLAYLSIVLALVIGSFFGFWLKGQGPGTIEYKTDTLWRYDTVRIPQPVPHIVRVIDTMLIQVVDTVHTRDSIFISVPKEEKVYEDSTYRAVVSGYRPSLDSISVFQKTAIVEVPVVKTVSKRWGVGIQAGATYLPKQGITPYVGVGVSYNLLTF